MKTRFVVKLGRALHECGTTSQRIERHLMNVTRMLGLNGSFLISPTTFTCAFWENDELDQFIHIERVEPAENNLGKLWEIDRLVETISDRKTPIEESMEQLDRVIHAPLNYSFWANALSWLLMGGSFALALKRAGLNAEDIDIVSTHATGTSSGDIQECVALRRVFGDSPRTLFNNAKSFIGHAMGAAGALELAGNLPALRINVGFVVNP